MLHSPLVATLIGALIIAPGGGSLYPHPAEATVCQRVGSEKPALVFQDL